ncbi:MAG TPA: xanthine dehydrogenase family protein subunit M [Terriglobales bacterium]|nr:xanthine dehydrogenase family protein subunit M [Terriglobales bacterium]
MYPRAFRYHRAGSLKEAATMLSQLGADAKVLAGGQSLIPLMKLRFANPEHLVDLNFVPGLSYVTNGDSQLRIGALTRHAEIEDSEIAARIPILHDCAAGIADVQVRNRGTVGGSLAEADPSGDWGPVLLTLAAEVRCIGPKGERVLPISKFFVDAYTSALAPNELVSEVLVKSPPKGSSGAYVAFKRSAPVYASASAAVQLTLEGDVCREAAIVLGAVGLMPIRVQEAEGALRGQKITPQTTAQAAEAARAAADPQPDMRGSAEYKRVLVAGLVKRAIEVAARRARGERVEITHAYC